MLGLLAWESFALELDLLLLFTSFNCMSILGHGQDSIYTVCILILKVTPYGIALLATPSPPVTSPPKEKNL